MRLGWLAVLACVGCNDYEFDPDLVEGLDDTVETEPTEEVDELIANDDVAEALGGIEIEINVVDNDDGSRPRVIEVGTPSDGGTAEITGRRIVTYASDAAFSGDESFSYTVDDTAGATATATVTVTVSPRPSIEITDPLDGSKEVGPTVTVSFQVDGCVVSRPSQAADECHIHMYVDGTRYDGEGNGPGHYEPAPREMFEIPTGSHNIEYRLVTNVGTDQEFAPLIADDINVTLP